MTNERTNQKVVFRTGSLIELDMVVGELNAQDIPNFTREEWSSGLRVAMPATPTVIYLPGTVYPLCRRLPITIYHGP